MVTPKKKDVLEEVNESMNALQEKINKQEREITRLKENNSAVIGIKPIQDRLLSEMDKLVKKSHTTAGKTIMKIIDDHKNVLMYWKNGYHIGKRVGPLHPANAKVEMGRFSRRGIFLSVDAPTESEITEYKSGDEYKRLSKEFDLKRSKKIRTKRTGEIDKLASAIEKLSGQKVTSLITSNPV